MSGAVRRTRGLTSWLRDAAGEDVLSVVHASADEGTTVAESSPRETGSAPVAREARSDVAVALPAGFRVPPCTIGLSAGMRVEALTSAPGRVANVSRWFAPSLAVTTNVGDAIPMRIVVGAAGGVGEVRANTRSEALVFFVVRLAMAPRDSAAMIHSKIRGADTLPALVARVSSRLVGPGSLALLETEADNRARIERVAGEVALGMQRRIGSRSPFGAPQVDGPFNHDGLLLAPYSLRPRVIQGTLARLAAQRKGM